MLEALFSWKDWNGFGILVWICLSLGFGVLFHHTATLVHEWWKRRRM